MSLSRLSAVKRNFVSPCRKRCALNASRTLCIGCGRTLEEIKAYGEAVRKSRHAEDARRRASNQDGNEGS
ncbi:MAG: DUF1289 domain-containing protein [Hymenobacter sp.]|nr:MAG: DUF1289 domain-containing protein [Hymenobacter sp.]